MFGSKCSCMRRVWRLAGMGMWDRRIPRRLCDRAWGCCPTRARAPFIIHVSEGDALCLGSANSRPGGSGWLQDVCGGIRGSMGFDRGEATAEGRRAMVSQQRAVLRVGLRATSGMHLQCCAGSAVKASRVIARQLRGAPMLLCSGSWRGTLSMILPLVMELLWCRQCQTQRVMATLLFCQR